jgi:hypothetical protein
MEYEADTGLVLQYFFCGKDPGFVGLPVDCELAAIRTLLAPFVQRVLDVGDVAVNLDPLGINQRLFRGRFLLERYQSLVKLAFQEL